MLTISATGKITTNRGNTMVLQFILCNYQLTTGDMAIFTLRKNYNLPVVLQKMVSQFESDGSAIFEFSASEMNISACSYLYDVTVILANGMISTVIPTNSFTVLEGITIE